MYFSNMSCGLLSTSPCNPLLPVRPAWLLLYFFIAAPSLVICQTPISGVVNSYYKVNELVPGKACVRVDNPSGLAYNDMVMLVQMKGASVNTSAGSSAFGDTISLHNAGNYEIGRVCAVIGDSVFLVFMILNDYDVDDKVQLVKIPRYVSATVTGQLKPASWNNTTGTGGILAISVEQDLQLNADVYADSSGFRGGEYRQSSGICGNTFIPPPANAFAYNANQLNPQDGGFKGESIAELAAAVSGGKGAPANGGGGGNNHNNGGGGGANLTAGGIGGGNSSSAGCTLTNPGRGGKPLSNYAGSRIFAGGGGGAGHSNFLITDQYGGGHGGGIVFIEAGNIIGNGFKISANGQLGGRAEGDGASGGGAGGTIILNVANFIGPVTVQANGGGGGTEDDQGTANRCYGGGGGGSGGAIYFSGAAPAITYTVNGGTRGPEIGRHAGCNPIVPAGDGAAGSTFGNYSYIESRILESSYCALLLPVHLISFTAIYKNETTLLNWQIAQPETALDFMVERSNDGINWSGMHTQIALPAISLYKATDPAPHSGTNYYRLKMTDINNVVNYSPVQKIYVSRSAAIRIYPNPAHKKIIITGNIAVNTITLFDLSGKRLWHKNIDRRQTAVAVDLPDLPAGIYIIKVGDTVSKLSIHSP